MIDEVIRKGQLLLLILYPPKLIFKYDEQLSVVFFLLILYALAAALTLMHVMYWRYANDQRLPITATWASAIFTVSCVLPTMLHIVLSVGQVVSAQRLKEERRGVKRYGDLRINMIYIYANIYIYKIGHSDVMLLFPIMCKL